MVGVSGLPPRQGALRGARGRRGGRGRALLDQWRGWAASRPEYEHHDFDVIWFTIEQPPGWSSTFYVSLGEVRGLMLPKYPHHIQAGILLPTGEWKRWRQEGVAAVAERVRRFDPIFAPFADQPDGLHAVLPAGGHHSLRPRLGPRRPAADRRRRAHHEPGRRHRRQRGLATAAVAAQVLLPASGHGARSRTSPARKSSGCARPTCARCTGCSWAPRACCWARGARNPHRAVAGAETAADPPALAAAAAGPAPDLLRRAAAAAGSRLQLPGAGTGAGRFIASG